MIKIKTNYYDLFFNKFWKDRKIKIKKYII